MHTLMKNNNLFGLQMSQKTFITDLFRGGKLNGENYVTWHLKMSYVLDEQHVIEVLTNVLPQPYANSPQSEQYAYVVQKRKDTITRVTLLAVMTDDVICQFEGHVTASIMWAALKTDFDSTSEACLRRIPVRGLMMCMTHDKGTH